MPYRYKHLIRMLIRHEFAALDLYFASHPGEIFDHFRTSAIRGISKSESIFHDYIAGYDKYRKRPFLCINMKMMDNDYNLHRVLRNGIQELDEFIIICPEDRITDSFLWPQSFANCLALRLHLATVPNNH